MQGIQRWMILPAWIGRVAIGLLGGLIFGWWGLPILLYAAERPLKSIGIRFEGGWFLAGPLACGAIGAGIALLVGAIVDRRAAARRERLAGGAGLIGAQFSAYDSELQQALRSDFPRRALAIQNVLRKDLVGLRVNIGDLSITESSGDSDSTQRQTAAYYRTEFPLPSFTLRPAGLMTKLMGAAGFQGVRFPEQPAFESRYFVLATDVIGTRALLNAPVRAWLAAHPGLGLEAGGNGILVYRSGKLLRAEELAAFLAEAAELVRLLEQSGRRADLKPTAPATPQDELRAFAAQMPAPVARSMEKQLKAKLVSREVVQAFVGQPPPRKIPTNIANNHRPALLIAAMGAFFAAMGAGAGVIAVHTQWIGLVLSTIFLLIGAPMLFFGGRLWWRRDRLLRRGELGAARIVGVEPAGWSDDDGEVFNVTATYQAAGQAQEGRCKVRGRPGKRGPGFAEQGKTAAILYDPVHPDRILLVDALIYPPEG